MVQKNKGKNKENKSFYAGDSEIVAPSRSKLQA